MSTPRAILFDMDGTLTRPLIDFDAIRAEIGVTGPILEAIRQLDADRQAVAMAVVERHERDAAERSELNDGCHALLAEIHARAIRTALITRNSRSTMDVILTRHGMEFAHRFSREEGPAKPHPESIWQACRSLGVAPEETWMVGDSHHDVDAGTAAGVGTIWLRHPGQTPLFVRPPDVVVSSLGEVLKLLREHSDSPDALSRV